MRNRRCVRYERGDAGYSLIEAIVVLAIAGVVLTAAAPSFLSTVQDNRLTTQINLLLADLHLARMAAIKRNQDVVLCRSSDGSHCDPSSDAEADWSAGWIVYVNPDGDEHRNPGEPLLRVESAIPRGLSLRFNQWWRVIFHADGSAKNGSFSLCDARGPKAARILILFYTGRPRISDKQANGGPIDCG